MAHGSLSRPSHPNPAETCTRTRYPSISQPNQNYGCVLPTRLRVSKPVCVYPRQHLRLPAVQSTWRHDQVAAQRVAAYDRCEMIALIWSFNPSRDGALQAYGRRGSEHQLHPHDRHTHEANWPTPIANQKHQPAASTPFEVVAGATFAYLPSLVALTN
ncbi:hypothetical protein CCM_06571 [Cordyceps militaris CM01]|uniref:Uncharacterized protein n=1 Tax=Cordyceps militaris (strain CM01) TaxID=983644 RepID=G3JMX0_CORMM|nr:uncharacterized protein CCM_06571 [Cordyceps militaris CM01]EGX90152.1 hypothetical protein CCM_06571 [Cordyceps militaris CM01]